MRRLWPVILALILLLPGLPPLLEAGLGYLAKKAGYQLELGRVRGYALLGLDLDQVRLEGPGVALRARHIAVDYQLLGLFSGTLPLRLELEGVRAELDPKLLIEGGGGQGGGGGVRPVLTGLVLEDVHLRTRAYEPWSLPAIELFASGSGPHRFTARLPGGEVRGEFALEPGLSVRFRAPATALSAWYPEVLGGALSGRVWLARDGLHGEGRVEDGRVRVVGFLVEEISGTYRLLPDRLEAELAGRGLEGPVRARAEVNWQEERYRFSVDAEPTWRAVAAHFGARLPLEGRGTLELSGEGWEKLRLSGRFSGEPRLLGYALPTAGELSYEDVFKLSARTRGRFYDRGLALDFDLTGEDWTLRYRDDRQGGFALRGRGSRAEGEGELALPEPLEGRARVVARVQGNRWQTRVVSEDVRLLGFKPFSLSGTLSGQGDRVAGRLGPVTVSGRWSDLLLQLAPLPLQLGTLSGELRWRGHFFGRFDYASPYVSFPVQVEEEAGRWRFLAPYGEGRYADGVFTLKVASLPIRFGETIVVSGDAVYRNGNWRGAFSARGSHLRAEAELRGREAGIEGAFLGPYGPLPFAGRYAEGALDLAGEGFSFGYREGSLYYAGNLVYGPVELAGELRYRGRFDGAVSLRAPELEARLFAQDGDLWLKSRGLLGLSGRLWPEPRLSGRFAGLSRGGLELPALPLRVEGARIQLGKGYLDLGARRLSLALPFTLYRQPGELRAEGGFESGRLTLRLPELGARLTATGPWRALSVAGGWPQAKLSLSGRLDLFALSYRARLERQGLEGALLLRGRGRDFRFGGTFRSQGTLTIRGDPGGFEARARGFALEPLGLAARLEGAFGYRGVPWAEASLQGRDLRFTARGRERVLLALEGAFARGSGVLEGNRLGFDLVLRHPYARGRLALRAGGEGVSAEGEGTLQLPGFEPARETFTLRGSSWRLAGPVSVRGQGLRYQGEVGLEGVLGRLSGSFSGRGREARFQGRLAMPRGAAEVRAELTEDGARLRLGTPGGELRYADGVLRVGRLDLGRLLAAYGLAAEGEARGALGKGGLLRGYLRAYGQELRFALRQRGGILWLPGLDAGARLRLGSDPLLRGIGALEGALSRTEEGWRGGFRLSGPLSGRFRVEGPRWSLVLRNPEGTLSLAGEGSRYRGGLSLSGPYLDGELRLAGKGLRYRGAGQLASKVLLQQSGPVRFSGEGARVEALWEAPLRVGYRDGVFSFQGSAPLAGGGSLSAKLSYRRQAGFSGRLELARGPFSGTFVGEGALRGRLRYPGGELRGQVRPDLSLQGSGGYRAAFLKSRLALSFDLGGRLFDPRLEGRGVLAGEGTETSFAFGYRQGAWARVRGPGLYLRLDGRFLELRAEDFSLQPYLGLPLRLRAGAAGDYRELTLPLALVGPGTELRGWARPAGPELRLSGRLWRGTAALAAGPDGVRLALDTQSPRVQGTLTWRPGSGLGGSLAFRQPLPGGALSGRFSGEEGVLELGGEGAVSGALSIWLADRRAQGGLRYRLSALGEIRLRGQGSRIQLWGEDGLAPLRGVLDLEQPAFAWHYRGPLPGGVGALRAQGRWPGRWLEGELSLGRTTLALRGEGGQLSGWGEGVSLHLSRDRLALSLEDFTLGPLRLRGGLEGSPEHFSGALDWRAWGRAGRAAVRFDRQLSLTLSGDLAGYLRVGAGGWRGRIEGPGLSLALEPRFRARGRLLGAPLWLDLEARKARLDGLEIGYPWSFSGTARIRGVRLRGAGDHLEAEALGFRLAAWPSPLHLALTRKGGRGALYYREGRLTGTLAFAWRGVRFELVGAGDRLRLSGRTPELPGFALAAGRLNGSYLLDGRWWLDFAAGPVTARAEGRGLGGRLRLESPYGGGTVEFSQGIRGDLSLAGWPFYGQALDLGVSRDRVRFRLRGPAGTAEGFLRFAGYRLVEGGAEAYALDLAGLPWIRQHLPHLVGRVGAVWRYDGEDGLLQVGSAGIGTQEEAYPLALTLRHGEEVRGTLVWAGLKADVSYRQGSYRFAGEGADFPLDLPVRLVVGPIDGGVRFTGRFAGGGPEPWLELAGERVRVYSPGQEMVGRVALAYRRGTLELRRLSFDGDGRMQGEGVWTFGRGGNLRLFVENADFSPLLMLDPRLARWRPEGRGSLELRARGERLEAEGRGRFRLASVETEVERVSLVYDAAGDRFELHADGRVRQPVESRFHLEGEGGLKAMRFTATGDLKAPLLAPLPEVRAELSYPGWKVSARAGEARLEGTLVPFDLTLSGVLPVTYPRYYLTSGEAESALRLVLKDDGLYHLSGEVRVLRALVSLPEERPQIETGKEKRVYPIAFDQVHLHADGGVVLNNPLAQGEAAGDLYLGGTAADPYLVGRAWALWGNFLLLNHRFEVEEGWARFSPELGIYPEIYLRARAETPKGPLYLIAEGRFVRRQDRAELVLDTCLAEEEVRRLEACKLLPQEAAAARLLGLGQGQLAEQMLEAAVKNLLIGQLESELAKSLGLDLFRFETGAFEGGGLESTRFTLGKYLSPELFLAYRYDFAKGSRIYASYRSGGFSLTFATDLSPDPNPEFSLGYTFTSWLSAYLRLEEDRFELGLEWRP